MLNTIDLGPLNKKQLDRLMEEIRNSSIRPIEVQIFQLKKNISSVVLRFITVKDRKKFDRKGEKLVNDLINLGSK